MVPTCDYCNKICNKTSKTAEASVTLMLSVMSPAGLARYSTVEITKNINTGREASPTLGDGEEGKKKYYEASAARL